MSDEFLGKVEPTPENIDALETFLLQVDEQGVPLDGGLSQFFQHALDLLERGEPVIFLANEPKSGARYSQPARLVKGARFVGQADQFDLWTGVDDEDDEVMVVVGGDDSYTVFVKDEVIEMSASSGPRHGGKWDKYVQAAIRGAVYECWIEGKV